MKLYSKLVALMAIVMAAGACDNPVPEPPTPDNKLAFTIDALPSGNYTKATDTAFETGDQIGIFAYKGWYDGEMWLDNVKFTKGSDGFSSSQTYYWYDNSSEESVILGIYPYDAAYGNIVQGVDFCVKSDQSTHAGYTASDLMVGVREHVAPTSEKVTLAFNHQLSKLVIDIKNQTNKEISEVFIDGVLGNYSYSPSLSEATGGAGTIKAGKLTHATSGYTDTYVLIIPPQSAAPKLAITTTDGKQYTWEQNEAVVFSSGKYRQMTVTMTDESISTEFDAIVNDWSADEKVEFTDQPGGGNNSKEMILNENWQVTYYGETTIDGNTYYNYVEALSQDDNTYYLDCMLVDDWMMVQEYPLYDYVSYLAEQMKELTNQYGGTIEDNFLYRGSIAGDWDTLDPGEYVFVMLGINPDGSVSRLYNVSESFIIASKPAVDTEYVIDQAQGYYDPFDGAPYYTLLLADVDNDAILQLFVNVDYDNTMDEGIPTGTYVVDTTYNPGTVDIGYIDEEYGVGGSFIMNLNQDTAKAIIVSGSISIVNNGNNDYDIDFEFTDQAGATHSGVYEGNISIADIGGGGDLSLINLNLDFAEMYFVGYGEWIAYIGDSTMDAVYQLDIIGAEDATFADGLASGTYSFAESYEPFTIWPGWLDSDGYYGGSLLLTTDMTGLYDTAIGGTLNVTNNGGDNYTFEVDIWGERYNCVGSYTGPVTAIDSTAEAAVAKAPAKKSAVKFANFNGAKKGATVKGMELTPETNKTIRKAINF